MHSLSRALVGCSVAAFFVTPALAQDNPCVSYGIDFQSGGSYFQNISSSDPFTFVSLFEGCDPDTCNNILVDPNGDEIQCSDTSLTPSDTNQLSTCPIDKSQLTSGDWSVLLISNNGDGIPIAYERDFQLSVGLPVTITATPTITVVVTSTPVVNSTTVIQDHESTTTTKIVTSPAVTKRPTTTVHPAKVTVTTTKVLGTVTRTKNTVIPTVITKTHTASCTIPRRQQHPDPTCTFHPTLVSAAALATTSAHPRAGKVADRAVPVDYEHRVAQRKARRAGARGLEKRAPDSATITVTDQNTDHYSTTTSSIIAAASTMVITSVSTTTTTFTATSTVYKGTTTYSQVTITAPTPTKSKTKFTVATAVTTKTLTPKVTITKTTTPAAASTICRAKGGHMV